MAPLSKKGKDVLLAINQHNEGRGKDDACSSNEASNNDDKVSTSNASGSNSKSGSSHTGTTDDEVNMINEELARHETKNVLRLRILVILLLVAVAAAVCYTIYDITHKAEIEAFERDFEGVAESIITSLNGKCQDMGCRKWFSESRGISRAVKISVPIQISSIAWPQWLVLPLPYPHKRRAGHL